MNQQDPSLCNTDSNHGVALKPICAHWGSTSRRRAVKVISAAARRGLIRYCNRNSRTFTPVKHWIEVVDEALGPGGA